MLKVNCLAFLVLIVVQSLSISSGTRLVEKLDGAEGNANTGQSYRPRFENREVIMLVTRHGLSCANIAAKWLNWLDSKWHANMQDPLLCKAGEITSAQAGKEVSQVLKQRGWTIDAVMSSVLVRALQTAQFQYSFQYPKQDPIWIMPYIRENGFGWDNIAESFEEQIKKVPGTHMNSSVNIHFADLAGRSTSGNWDNFKRFVEEQYFPAVRFEPKDGPIVIVVVTHSNFMKTGELAKKCGKVHPNNNQVVAIPYTLKTKATEKGDIFFSLQDSALDGKTCTPVINGTALPYQGNKLQPLCMKDIGPACIAQLTQNAYMPETIESYHAKLLDKQEEIRKSIEAISKEPITAEEKRDRIQEKAEEQPKLWEEAENLKKLHCLTGGHADV